MLQELSGHRLASRIGREDCKSIQRKLRCKSILIELIVSLIKNIVHRLHDLDICLTELVCVHAHHGVVLQVDAHDLIDGFHQILHFIGQRRFPLSAEHLCQVRLILILCHKCIPVLCLTHLIHTFFQRMHHCICPAGIDQRISQYRRSVWPIRIL